MRLASCGIIKNNQLSALSGDNRDVCFSTSTIFVSVMMMRRASSFRGFLCRGQLLEGVHSSTVQHVVCADDGSISVSQLTDGTS